MNQVYEFLGHHTPAIDVDPNPHLVEVISRLLPFLSLILNAAYQHVNVESWSNLMEPRASDCLRSGVGGNIQVYIVALGISLLVLIFLPNF